MCSPKRGLFYGQKGVLVELNRQRSVVFFPAKKGNSEKSTMLIVDRLYVF